MFISSWICCFTRNRTGKAQLLRLLPCSTQECRSCHRVAKEIEKRTAGKVQITVFPGGTLTPADKCYDGVVKGLSDIGFSVLAYTRGKFPLTEVVDLPLGSKTGLASTKLINEYYKKFKPKELDEVKVMYLHGHGPGILHTKAAVNKLEDMKGKKIRCTGNGCQNRRWAWSNSCSHANG